MTATSWPRARRAWALWSTCSVTPPTAGWYAWLRIPILSGIAVRKERPEDAPLVEVRGDGALLRLGDPPRERRHVLTQRKLGPRHLESVEDDAVPAVLAPLGVRVHHRSARPPGEERGAHGEPDPTAEEQSLHRAHEDVAVGEEHHKALLAERPEEGAESVARRAHEDPFPFLDAARASGDPRVELDAGHHVHTESYTSGIEPSQHPVDHEWRRDVRTQYMRQCCSM